MRSRRCERREDDLTRELRAHLDLEAEEQRRAGVAPEQARYAALRAFGNRTCIEEDTRMTPLMSHVLYQVRPLDAGVLALVSVALLLICSLACAVPARRATRVDPVTALRYE